MEKLIAVFSFLTIGSIFSFSGFSILKSNRRIQKSGVKTKAKIIDFIEKSNNDARGDSHTYHFPIVEFRDKNGIKTTQRLNSSANGKQINEPIDIIYLKKDNEYEIMMNSSFWKKFFPIVFIIVGLLIFGIGILILISLILN